MNALVPEASDINDRILSEEIMEGRKGGTKAAENVQLETDDSDGCTSSSEEHEFSSDVEGRRGHTSATMAVAARSPKGTSSLGVENGKEVLSDEDVVEIPLDNPRLVEDESVNPTGNQGKNVGLVKRRKRNSMSMQKSKSPLKLQQKRRKSC